MHQKKSLWVHNAASYRWVWSWWQPSLLVQVLLSQDIRQVITIHIVLTGDVYSRLFTLTGPDQPCSLLSWSPTFSREIESGLIFENSLKKLRNWKVVYCTFRIWSDWHFWNSMYEPEKGLEEKIFFCVENAAENDRSRWRLKFGNRPQECSQFLRPHTCQSGGTLIMWCWKLQNPRYEYFMNCLIKNVTGSFLAISSEAGSIKMGKKKSGLGPLCCLETEIIKFHNYNIIILLDCWDRQWYWGCPLSVTHGVFSMFGSDIWFWWKFCQQVDLCVLCIWKDSLASKAERCRLPITSKPRSVLSCRIKQEQPRNQTNRRNE